MINIAPSLNWPALLNPWKEYFQNFDELVKKPWKEEDPLPRENLLHEKNLQDCSNLLVKKIGALDLSDFQHLLFYVTTHTHHLAIDILSNLKIPDKNERKNKLFFNPLEANPHLYNLSLLSIAIILKKDLVSEYIVINYEGLLKRSDRDIAELSPLDHAILARHLGLVKTLKKFISPKQNQLGFESQQLDEVINHTELFALYLDKQKLYSSNLSDYLPQYKDRTFRYGVNIHPAIFYSLWFSYLKGENKMNFQSANAETYAFVNKICSHFSYLREKLSRKPASRKPAAHKLCLKSESNEIKLYARKSFKEDEILFFANDLYQTPEIGNFIKPNLQFWGFSSFVKHSFPNAIVTNKGGIPVFRALTKIKSGDCIFIDNGIWKPSQPHQELQTEELRIFLAHHSIWELPELLKKFSSVADEIKKSEQATLSGSVSHRRPRFSGANKERSSSRRSIDQKSDNVSHSINEEKECLPLEDLKVIRWNLTKKISQWEYIFLHSPSLFKLILWGHFTNSENLPSAELIKKFVKEVKECEPSPFQVNLLDLFEHGHKLIKNYLDLTDDKVLFDHYLEEQFYYIFLKNHRLIFEIIEQFSSHLASNDHIKKYVQIFKNRNIIREEELHELKSDLKLPDAYENFERILKKIIDLDSPLVGRFAYDFLDLINASELWNYHLLVATCRKILPEVRLLPPGSIFEEIASDFRANSILSKLLSSRVIKDEVFKAIFFSRRPSQEKIGKNLIDFFKNELQKNERLKKKLCVLIHALMQNSEFGQSYFNTDYNPLILTTYNSRNPEEMNRPTLYTPDEIQTLYNKPEQLANSLQRSLKKLTQEFYEKIACDAEITILFIQDVFKLKNSVYVGDLAKLNRFKSSYQISFEFFEKYVRALNFEKQVQFKLPETTQKGGSFKLNSSSKKEKSKSHFVSEVCQHFREFLASNISVLIKKRSDFDSDSEEDNNLNSSLGYFATKAFSEDLEAQVSEFIPTLRTLLFRDDAELQALAEVKVELHSSSESGSSPNAFTKPRADTPRK